MFWHWLFLFWFIFSILRFLSYHNKRTRVIAKANFNLQPMYLPRSIPKEKNFIPFSSQTPDHEHLVDVPGQVKLDTQKAWLFYNGSITIWLPKSQVEWDERDKIMTMPTWLAKEKGLVQDADAEQRKEKPRPLRSNPNLHHATDKLSRFILLLNRIRTLP